MKAYEKGTGKRKEGKANAKSLPVSNASDIQMRHFKPYLLFIIFTFFI